MPLSLIAGGMGCDDLSVQSLLLSCSRHWDNFVFFIENYTIEGQLSRMSHSRAQSGKSVISSGIPQNVPQHWLDWTVFEIGIQIPEAEMGGQNALKLCLG